MESSESALSVLRRYINRPSRLFDRYEATQLLQSLLRLARSEGHEKAGEYSAALDEVSSRLEVLDDAQIQRLFLGLLGDPLRAKVAKDATSILKNIGASHPTGGRGRAVFRRPAPYPFSQIQCYRCQKYGHMARSCRSGRRPGPARGRF